MHLVTWFLSADVLETVFDGLLGAAVGAGVAVVVLRLTLREQREALTAQLAKQDEHHQEQLRVQQEENSHQRLHETVAVLLTTFKAAQEALRETEANERKKKMDQASQDFAVAIERLHLDIGPDRKFYFALRELLIRAIALTRQTIRGDAGSPSIKSLEELYSWVGGVLVYWFRGSTNKRDEAIRILRKTLSYVNEHGADKWERLSKDVKMGRPLDFYDEEPQKLHRPSSP